MLIFMTSDLSDLQSSTATAPISQPPQYAKQPMYLPVADTLAQEILEGQWPIGTSMTLEHMQTRFVISRTVAREVSQYLESTGATIARRRIGLISQDPKQWHAFNTQVIEWKLHSKSRTEELLELTELRLAIEPVAAAGAARNATIDAKAKLLVLATQMRAAAQSHNLNEFHKLDVEFHSLLLEESGNELFCALAPVVSTVLRGRVEINLYPAQPKPEALDAHEHVAYAIYHNDSATARAAMHDIVDEVETAIAGDNNGSLTDASQ